MTIMKTRFLMTAVFLVLAMTASAQIQLLFMGYNRNVIDRNKKLYWMDGDDDPCFNILNYKKAGTKETFTIKEKDSGSQTYSVTITLDSKGNPVHLVLKDGKNALYDSEVKTSSGSVSITTLANWPAIPPNRASPAVLPFRRSPVQPT